MTIGPPTMLTNNMGHMQQPDNTRRQSVEGP